MCAGQWQKSCTATISSLLMLIGKLFRQPLDVFQRRAENGVWYCLVELIQRDY